MRPLNACLGCLALGAAAWTVSAHTRAGGLQQLQTPVFRSGVDLAQLDVTVYDKDHHVLTGLTAADFTVLEDDRPRPIAAFAAVDLPDPPLPTAAWLRDAPSDVATNDIEGHRLFLIVIDDASFGEQLMYKTIRDQVTQAARKVIDHLGPTDLASVVLTGDNSRSQDFTSDHGRLIAALAHINGPTMPEDVKDVYAVEALRRAADYLIGVPGRRKAFIDLTGFDMSMAPCPPPPYGGNGCSPAHAYHDYLIGQTTEIFESAQRAGVNVYLMRLQDHLGLGGITTSDVNAVNPESDWFLRVPKETGGEAFLGVHDPAKAEAAVDRIFEANSHYYVLGYTSADLHKFHRIKVLVDRPGAEVRARDKYYWPEPARTPAGPPPAATLGSIASLLPNGAVAMRASAAAFRSARGAALAVVIGIHQQLRDGAPAPTTDQLELRTALFTAEGQARGTDVRTVQVVFRPGAHGDGDYEVLARVDAPKPGLYEIRMGGHSQAFASDGSVYLTVDVPDFTQPLTMSGVVVTVSPALPIGGAAALASFVPVVPTTQRTFSRGDQAAALVRVYEGGRGPIRPVPLRVHIVDDHDRAVLDRAETLAVDRFDVMRASDVRIALPLATLSPGAYLLSVDASLGAKTAHRDLRFSVKP